MMLKKLLLTGLLVVLLLPAVVPVHANTALQECIQEALDAIFEQFGKVTGDDIKEAEAACEKLSEKNATINGETGEQSKKKSLSQEEIDSLNQTLPSEQIRGMHPECAAFLKEVTTKNTSVVNFEVWFNNQKIFATSDISLIGRVAELSRVSLENPLGDGVLRTEVLDMGTITDPNTGTETEWEAIINSEGVFQFRCRRKGEAKVRIIELTVPGLFMPRVFEEDFEPENLTDSEEVL